MHDKHKIKWPMSTVNPARAHYNIPDPGGYVKASIVACAMGLLVSAALVFGCGQYIKQSLENMLQEESQQTTVNASAEALAAIHNMPDVKGLNNKEKTLALDAVKTISTYDAQSLSDGSWSEEIGSFANVEDISNDSGHTNLLWLRWADPNWSNKMKNLSSPSSVVEELAVQSVETRSDAEGNPYRVVTVKTVTTRNPKDGFEPEDSKKLSSYSETYKVYMNEDATRVRNIQHTSAEQL